MIDAVISAGFTVTDMDSAIGFYTTVLPFKVINDLEVYDEAYEQLQGLFGVRMRVVTLQLGEEKIDLTQYLTPTGRPIPVESRSNDRWFQHIAIVVKDMDQAYDHLRRHKTQHVSTAPQTIPESNIAAAGIRAFYFRDGDGHNLEIIYFPAGKGDPRWQQGNDLFLGIDHTAIAVSNTAQSLEFYRNLLGLRVAGESENYGTEQAHLNLVKEARLHISGLRAARGIGIEFLEYLHPKTGRPMPSDTQANDVWFWQTTLACRNLDARADALRAANFQFISEGVIAMPDDRLGFKRGFLVCDPDGHAIRLVER